MWCFSLAATAISKVERCHWRTDSNNKPVRL
jgi:hypothetical protein